jgi:hypothetical protein
MMKNILTLWESVTKDNSSNGFWKTIKHGDNEPKKRGSQKRMINNEKNKQSASLKRISILIKIILFL